MATEKINVLDPQGVKDFAKVLLGKTELQIDARIVQELTEAATNKQVPSAVVVKALYDALQAKDTEIEGKIDGISDGIGANFSEQLDSTKTRIETIEGTVNEHASSISSIDEKNNDASTKITEINEKATVAEAGNNNNGVSLEAVNTLISALDEKINLLKHLKIETVVGPIDSVVEPKEDMLYFQKDNEEDPTWVLYIYNSGKWIPVGDTSIDLVNYWSKDDTEEIKNAIGLENVEPLTKDEINTIVDAAFAKLNDPARFFVFDNETGTITGLTDEGKTATELVIPSTINDVDVTSIGEGAFCGCTALTSVTLPSTLTSIGGYAFEECTQLTSITIPSTLTSIGGYAFQNCTALTSITIPEGVTTIGEGAFKHCEELTSVTIPEGVLTISNYAFCDCKALQSVTLPSTVTNIGEGAFYGCKALTSITIPEGVLTIDGQAFSGCTALQSVTLPSTVTNIDWSAFLNCTALTSVTIPEGVTSIGNYAFSGCTALQSVTLPSTLTSIGIQAFADCTALQSVNIPEGVTIISEALFRDCTSLQSVNIPEGVTSIGYDAFCNCEALTSINIPSTVTTISESAFYGCTSLTDVYYNGTEGQWNSININATYNDALINATKHFK